MHAILSTKELQVQGGGHQPTAIDLALKFSRFKNNPTNNFDKKAFIDIAGRLATAVADNAISIGQYQFAAGKKL